MAMSKISERKNRAQFLQKFQDKKQVVDREGLIKILESKRKQIGNCFTIEEKSNQRINNTHKSLLRIKKQKVATQNSKAQSYGKKQKSKVLQKQQIFIRSKKHSENEAKIKSRQFGERMQKQGKKSQQFQQGLKLPIIKRPLNLVGLQKNKSQNLLAKQIYANSKLKNNEIQTQVSEISNRLSNKFYLDKYALKHLQLLNRFQRLLIDSRLSSGQKAVINVKMQ